MAVAEEIAGGGAARGAARRGGEQGAAARLGAGPARLPPVRVADKTLEGVTCIRLDATVIPAHSDKELAEPNFKGFDLLTELAVASSQFSGRVA